MSDVSDAIEEAAEEGIQFASGDQGSVRQHSLLERIAADKYSRAVSAAGSASRGLRFSKLVAPGTISRATVPTE